MDEVVVVVVLRFLMEDDVDIFRLFTDADVDGSRLFTEDVFVCCRYITTFD